MKPPKFHVGQAVVCIKSDASRADSIKKGRVYQVGKITGSPKCWHYWPLGKADGWREDFFSPVELLTDKALTALLEQSLIPALA